MIKSIFQNKTNSINPIEWANESVIPVISCWFCLPHLKSIYFDRRQLKVSSSLERIDQNIKWNDKTWHHSIAFFSWIPVSPTSPAAHVLFCWRPIPSTLCRRPTRHRSTIWSLDGFLLCLMKATCFTSYKLYGKGGGSNSRIRTITQSTHKNEKNWPSSLKTEMVILSKILFTLRPR